jgi:hypothetical protein
MNEKDLRDVLAMFILNGMLSRLPSEEIEPSNIWYLADAMIESRDAKPIGLPPIKRRKKSES